MGLETPATVEMIKNVINGVTPPKIADSAKTAKTAETAETAKKDGIYFVSSVEVGTTVNSAQQFQISVNDFNKIPQFADIVWGNLRIKIKDAAGLYTIVEKSGTFEVRNVTSTTIDVIFKNARLNGLQCFFNSLTITSPISSGTILNVNLNADRDKAVARLLKQGDRLLCKGQYAIPNSTWIYLIEGEFGSVYTHPDGYDVASIRVNSFNNTTINQSYLSLYPVGSYYITESTTSPASIIGGEWVQVKDRFILGATSNSYLGREGGQSSVTLTEAQMPRHSHYPFTALAYSQELWAYDTLGSQSNKLGVRTNTGNANATYSSQIRDSLKGNNESFNIIPLYRMANIWRRTK